MVETSPARESGSEIGRDGERVPGPRGREIHSTGAADLQVVPMSWEIRPEPVRAASAPGAAGRRRVEPAVAVLVCVGCLLPFVHKAFCIDDPLFLWAAQH